MRALPWALPERRTRWSLSPLRFAGIVLLAHIVLALPILAWHGFDASVFVVAGDRFVTAAHTPAPLIVRAHSDGYDGQFYYRLALAPFQAQASAFGITLDHPAWRMQRIFLPLLARALSLGNPAALAWAFLAINLMGIVAIAALAAALARRYDWPWQIQAAIAFWPAWLIALTHDTTEILAASLLLASLAAYLAQRLSLYAALMALATLTRETAILAALGIAAAEAWRLWHPPGPRAWRRPFAAAVALLPFLVWRHLVARLWHATPQAHGVAQNAGWPLAGWTETAIANLFNHAAGAAPHPRNALMRVTVLASMAVVVLFVSAAVPAAIATCRAGVARGMAAGWLLIFALMTLLTANGPLIEPTAYFRALTECWITGWLVLGTTGRMVPFPRAMLTVLLLLAVRNWQLCLLQLR